jgi:hypothetical protein
LRYFKSVVSAIAASRVEGVSAKQIGSANFLSSNGADLSLF